VEKREGGTELADSVVVHWKRGNPDEAIQYLLSILQHKRTA
jgi:hypothetical protein